MNTQLMADFDARSYEEQQDYLRELEMVNNTIKAVKSSNKKGKVYDLNPDTNYKLTYR